LYISPNILLDDYQYANHYIRKHHNKIQQNQLHEIPPHIPNKNHSETTPSLPYKFIYTESYPTNTQKKYNKSNYYFRAIFSDGATAQ
jgi:hypothetical protein